MESIGLEMEDIFGAEVNDREDIGAEQNAVEPTENPDEEENTFDANTTARLAKGAAKKVVRNPQPKLDPQRLTGQRGIAILPKLFENVKFKGKGYEAQDLEKVIKGLEHWAHRLFPKRTFDECLQTIEKLGNKNEVKTCIKKIRLDMPLLDEDFVSKPEEVLGNTDINDQDDVNEAENAFDEMMQTSTSSQLMSPTSSQIPVSLPPPSQPNCSSKSKTVLSDELKEKIERNRRLALEKRAQKLQNQDISLSIPLSQDEEKRSQVTQTHLSATTKQCHTSVAADEPSGANAAVIASGNSESVDSGDDAKQVTSFGIDTYEALVNNASPIPTNKDSVSSADDEPYSDDKKLMTQVCDKSFDIDTYKDLGDNVSPVPTNKDSVFSDVKKPMIQVCDKSSDIETYEAIGDNVSPISTNKDSVSSADDEPFSDDKKPMTQVCNKSFDIDTDKDLGDNVSPIPTNKDSVSSADDEPFSDVKKPMIQVCDKSVDIDTDKALGDNVSPIPTNKDSVSSADDEPFSDVKKPMIQVCDKSFDIDTDKTLGDNVSPIPTNKDSVSSADDEPFSDVKKPMIQVCDKSFDIDTDKALGDNVSPIPTNKDSVSSADDEPFSDVKKPMIQVCDKSFDIDTDKALGDNVSPIPTNKDSVSSADDEPFSDVKEPMIQVCDKSVDIDTDKALGDNVSNS